VPKNRFGDYNIIKLVHDGEKSVVYQARHLYEDKLAAIKVYRQEFNRTIAKLREKYGVAGEGEIGLQLNPADGIDPATHPLVITLGFGTEFGKADGNEYVVLEYLEGLNLKYLISCQHRLVTKHKIGIMRQVARGLRKIHEHGMIHRDFCTDNVLVADGPRAKIIDMGFVVPGGMAFEEKTGTPSYMSPEQINAEPLDEKSDIYSLGIVMYEICTGRLPFTSDLPDDTPKEAAKKRAEVMDKHLNDAPTPVRRLAPKTLPAVEDVIMKCIEKDPKDRFQDVKSVSRALPKITSRPQAKAKS